MRKLIYNNYFLMLTLILALMLNIFSCEKSTPTSQPSGSLSNFVVPGYNSHYGDTIFIVVHNNFQDYYIVQWGHDEYNYFSGTTTTMQDGYIGVHSNDSAKCFINRSWEDSLTCYVEFEYINSDGYFIVFWDTSFMVTSLTTQIYTP